MRCPAITVLPDGRLSPLRPNALPRFPGGRTLPADRLFGSVLAPLFSEGAASSIQPDGAAAKVSHPPRAVGDNGYLSSERVALR